MATDIETSHFWLGSFPDKDNAYDYFEEVYDENDEDRDYTPLSKFAGSQNEKWYDHDFMELGFKGEAASVTELVAGHSYCEQYAEELENRCKSYGLKNINFFIYITEGEIKNPVSVLESSFSLNYVGKITYKI